MQGQKGGEVSDRNAEGKGQSSELLCLVLFNLYLLNVTIQKDDTDKKGGETIRNHSLNTLGLHAKAPDTNTDTDTNSSDEENIDPRSIAGSSKWHKTKHEKAKGQSTSEMRKIHEMLTANEEQWGLFEGRIVKALEDSTAVYERTQEKFINVLTDKLN